MITRGRTRPDIAGLAYIVARLRAAARKFRLLRSILWNAVGCGRNVVHTPVIEATGDWCIRIVDDQRKSFRSGGSALPGEFGRNVAAFAGELFGYVAAELES